MSAEDPNMPLSLGATPVQPISVTQTLSEQSEQAAGLLKALSHGGRLKILCLLVDQERSVTELEHLLNQRQAAVSQQLARLRSEGLVHPRRDGKAIYYSLADQRVRAILNLLSGMFPATA